MISNLPTRERILLHAEERFMRDGFAKVSVDDLATELVMSKKTLYKVFASKEALVEATVMKILGETARAVQSIAQADGDFITKLHRLIVFLGTVYRRIESPLVRDLQRHMPKAWEKVDDFRGRRILEVFSSLIQQGLREGYVRDDINVRLFSLAFVGAVQSVVRPSVLIDESFSAKGAVEGILQMFFRGILTPKGNTAVLAIRTKDQSQEQTRHS